MNNIPLSLSSFKEFFSPKDKIIIYGAGDVGKLAIGILCRLNLEKTISQIVDKNMHGTIEQSTQVMIERPDRIPNHPNQKVIIASFEAYKNEIYKTLTDELKITPNNIITLSIQSATNFESTSSENWNNGASNEVFFWTKVFATRNQAENNLDKRNDPNKPFNQNLIRLLDYPKNSPIKVLDVGSGPVTMLGYQCENHTISITCIDPLANEYKKIYKDYDFNPLIEPMYGWGETLDTLFPENQFDIVHSNNAIDHSVDPLSILKNMYKVLKKGGLFYVCVAENEAENNLYTGLHQWNFSLEGSDIILWNRSESINLNKEIPVFHQLHGERNKTNHKLITFYTKKG